MKKILLFLFVLIAYHTANCQIDLSPSAKISVVTCGPGNELYSTFGHSAFRVEDRPNQLDRVYNYGTFNFNTPNFYLKFIQGKLLYELRAYDFVRFLKSYQYENRWVKEQVLDLNEEQIQKIFNYLENNALPENRAYHYDFFYDNCSTKLIDVLEEVLGEDFKFDPDYDKNIYTHRQLIEQYLGSLPWSDFGIDLALGADIDRSISTKEYMFLPDYVFKSMEKNKLQVENRSIPIVKETKIILNSQLVENRNFEFKPLWLFSLLALVVVFLTYRDFKQNKGFVLTDYLVFGITGFLGVIVLLLWFATDHSATANNFNILWAFAPNLIFIFLRKRLGKVEGYYFFTLLALLDVLVLLWLAKIQIFSTVIIPILVILYSRYVYLWFGSMAKNRP